MAQAPAMTLTHASGIPAAGAAQSRRAGHMPQSAFDLARRHSRRVRFLKLVLPVLLQNSRIRLGSPSCQLSNDHSP